MCKILRHIKPNHFISSRFKYKYAISFIPNKFTISYRIQLTCVASGNVEELEGLAIFDEQTQITAHKQQILNMAAKVGVYVYISYRCNVWLLILIAVANTLSSLNHLQKIS